MFAILYTRVTSTGTMCDAIPITENGEISTSYLLLINISQRVLYSDHNTPLTCTLHAREMSINLNRLPIAA